MIERVWVISWHHWSDSYSSNGRLEEEQYVEDEEGFFLLEADALTRVDELNATTKQMYVDYCSKLNSQREVALAAQDVQLRKNELLLQHGFEAEPVKDLPALASPLTFEDWLRRTQSSWYDSQLLNPGKVSVVS